jgi:hypothetical protein
MDGWITHQEADRARERQLAREQYEREVGMVGDKDLDEEFDDLDEVYEDPRELGPPPGQVGGWVGGWVGGSGSRLAGHWALS